MQEIAKGKVTPSKFCVVVVLSSIWCVRDI